ncbi:DUF192 domain-containing protein [bacterium]|nr:DUF192 domain-containing protein [bacterium]
MNIILLNLLQVSILGIFLIIVSPKIIFGNMQVPEFKKTVCEININNKKNKKIYVEIADTEKKRSYGLMNREEIMIDNGMLFIWDKSEKRNFWMKNTLLNLDLFFINMKGIIVGIYRNAKALDQKNISSNEKVKFVLEMKAGELKSQVGDKLDCPIIKY